MIHQQLPSVLVHQEPAGMMNQGQLTSLNQEQTREMQEGTLRARRTGQYGQQDSTDSTSLQAQEQAQAQEEAGELSTEVHDREEAHGQDDAAVCMPHQEQPRVSHQGGLQARALNPNPHPSPNPNPNPYDFLTIPLSLHSAPLHCTEHLLLTTRHWFCTDIRGT